MTTYVDSSVVLRIVLGEGGKLAGWAGLAPISSELTKVECLRTIERLRLTTTSTAPELLAERRAAVLSQLRAFRLVAVSTEILDRAGDPFPTYVATLDAIHLSTALILREDNPEIAFATHDVKLAAAARSMGFQVSGV